MVKTPSFQRSDAVGKRSRPRLHRLAAACLVLAGWPCGASGQFLPPGVLNPAAADDRNDTQEFDVDQVIAPDGTIHAVFTSAYDYSGTADSDLDVWYVKNSGSGWTAPVLVNRHYGGGDTAWDRHPKLALAQSGTLYCVWETEHPGDGLGPDADVLFAELFPGATEWSSPAVTLTDNFDDDVFPWVVAGPHGRPMVIWERQNPTWAVNWSERSSTGWSPPATLAFDNPSQSSGLGSLVVSSSPRAQMVVASWSTADGTFVTQFPNPYGAWEWTYAFDLESNPFWPGLGSSVHVAAVRDAEDGLVFHMVLSGLGSGGRDIYHVVAFGAVSNLFGQFTPVNTDAATNSDDDYRPRLCVEPSGSVHVVWRRRTDSQDSDVFHAVGTHTNELPFPPQFSPPVTIGGQGDVDGPGAWDDVPIIACAPDGQISAMWLSQDDLGGTIGDDWDVLHAMGIGRLFETPEPLRSDWRADGPTEDEISPAIAPMTGGLISVYATYTTDNLNGSYWFLQSKRYAFEDGYWTAVLGGVSCCFGEMLDPALATGPTGLPDLVFAGRHALSGQDLDVFHTRFDGEGWPQPTVVGSLGQSNDGPLDDDRQPAVAVTGDDTVHVAFAERSIDRIVVYEKAAGVQWSPTTIPGSYLAPSLYSAVTLVASEGELQLAFVATHPTSSQSWVFWSRRDPISGWTSAEPVGPASSSGTDVPVLAPLGEDDAVVVWISNRDVAGEGSDGDLLLARRSETGWSAPVPLLFLQYFDVAADRSLVGAANDGRLHLAWVSELDLGGTAGLDPDVLYTDVDLTAAPPLLTPVVLANPDGHGDLYGDAMPALAVDPAGDVWVAWVRPDPQAMVPDLDPWASRRRVGVPLPSLLFADGFEQGTTDRWSDTVP